MKRILALIYKSYESRNLNIPYFRTLMTIVGPLLLLIALGQGILKMHLLDDLSSSLKYLIVGLILCLLVIIFSRVYRKEELNKYQFSQVQLKRTSQHLIIYFVCILLVVSGILVLRMKHII
jgi:hypothetical protein